MKILLGASLLFVALISTVEAIARPPIGTVRAITVDDVYKLEAGMTEAEVVATIGKPWGRHEEPRPHNQPDVKDLKQCTIYPIIREDADESANPSRIPEQTKQPVYYAIAVVFREGRVVEWGRYGDDRTNGMFCMVNAGLM
jgi:hypothetical protein